MSGQKVIVYTDGAWTFDLDENAFGDGIAFKFVLTPGRWMAGGNLYLPIIASDADGDPLLFSLQFSPDAGNTWQSVRVLTPEPGAFLDASGLLVGAEVKPSMGGALYIADEEDMLSRGLPERIPSTPLCASFALPDGAEGLPGFGTYLAFLDVWQTGVTALEDPSIREVGLHGADTATRDRTVI